MDEFSRQEKETRDWIERILNRKLKGDTLGEALYNSTVLCEFIDTLYPTRVPPLYQGWSEDDDIFKPIALENIEFIIGACKENGVAPNELFKPIDLYEQGNLKQVYTCLLKLKQLEDYKERERQKNLEDKGYRLIKRAPGGREENTKKEGGFSSWWTIGTWPARIVARFPWTNFIIKPIFIGISIGIGVKLGNGFFAESSISKFLGQNTFKDTDSRTTQEHSN